MLSGEWVGGGQRARKGGQRRGAGGGSERCNGSEGRVESTAETMIATPKPLSAGSKNEGVRESVTFGATHTHTHTHTQRRSQRRATRCADRRLGRTLLVAAVALVRGVRGGCVGRSGRVHRAGGFLAGTAVVRGSAVVRGRDALLLLLRRLPSSSLAVPCVDRTGGVAVHALGANSSPWRLLRVVAQNRIMNGGARWGREARNDACMH